MARSADVKTPKCRFAFTQSLFKPQVDEKSGKKFWTVSLLFPKGTDLSALEAAALEAAKSEWGDKAEQMLRNGAIKSPFLDGDGAQGVNKKTGERHPGFAGHRFIRCKSGEDYRPVLIGPQKQQITKPEELYSGCFGFAVVNVFTWDNKEQGKGLTFGLSMVQKGWDGDRLGGAGGVDIDKYAEVIEDTGPAAEATKSGAGAAGLFD